MTYDWTRDEREAAKRLAQYAGGRVMNGPTSGDLKLAAAGGNEDLLYAIHLMSKLHRDNPMNDPRNWP